jgi:hypothetical protein
MGSRVINLWWDKVVSFWPLRLPSHPPPTSHPPQPRPNLKKNRKAHVWDDPMPELTITSPYARVDYNTFTTGNPMQESTLINPMPESTLSPSQGFWLWPPDTIICMYVQWSSDSIDLFFWMTRLSRCLMILLLHHPLPPLTWQQVASLSDSSCVSPVMLTDGRGGAKS